MAKDPTKREVWHPADYDKPDVRAVQALTEYARLAVEAWDEQTMGPAPATPSPAEVKRFLDWVIHGAAQTYDNGFVPNDPNGRIAAYIDGRQSVGQQIVKLSKLKPAIFERREE